jgi:hypothetical protein
MVTSSDILLNRWWSVDSERESNAMTDMPSRARALNTGKSIDGLSP